MRAAVHVRLSDDRQGDALGVARQEADCRALAERLGWDVVDVYAENDTSAFQRRVVTLPDGTTARRVLRPAFRRMLSDLASGQVDALIAYDLDRIARDPRDLEDLIDVVEERGCPAKSVTGSLDLSNDAGITMARVMVAVANKSSRDTSRRVKRKYEELAAAGKNFNGGYRPFGWQADRLTHNEAEAAILRECYDGVLAGKGIRTLVRDLDQRGIRTTLGNPWTAQALRYALLSPRQAGLRAHKGAIVGPAVWHALVDMEVWEQVRSRLTSEDRPNVGMPQYVRRYLLSRVLRCGLCGSPLKASRNKDVQRFACRPEPGDGRCGKILVRYAPLEEHVVELLLARLEQQADLQPDAPADPTDLLREQIAHHEGRLAGLAEVYADGGDAFEMRRAGQIIRERIADLRRQISQAAVVQRLADPVQVRSAWPSYDLEQRREVVDILLERVDVGPAKRGLPRFDPARLGVRWR